MKTILEDKGKRSMFGEAAREFVATNFKREVIWEALRKEYMDMLQNQTDTKTQSGILVQEGNSRKT
jgi:hypothetical protein